MGVVGVKLKHQITHSICSTITLYYSRIQKLLFRSEIYSLPVIIHIVPTLVNLQGNDSWIGRTKFFRLLHGLRLFYWPRLSPPSDHPPGLSSTCVWGGDPLEGRCLLFEPYLTFYLDERLRGNFLTLGIILIPSVSKIIWQFLCPLVCLRGISLNLRLCSGDYRFPFFAREEMSWRQCFLGVLNYGPRIQGGFDVDENGGQHFVCGLWPPNTFRMHLFVVPSILSHHPHKAALRAMDFHVMPYWARRRCVFAARGSPTALRAACSPRGTFAHCQFRL